MKLFSPSPPTLRQTLPAFGASVMDSERSVTRTPWPTRRAEPTHSPPLIKLGTSVESRLAVTARSETFSISKSM